MSSFFVSSEIQDKISKQEFQNNSNESKNDFTLIASKVFLKDNCIYLSVENLKIQNRYIIENFKFDKKIYKFSAPLTFLFESIQKDDVGKVTGVICIDKEKFWSCLKDERN